MPLLERAVESIAGCENWTHLHLAPQFCCPFFQNWPGLARVSFSYSNSLESGWFWSQARGKRTKSLPIPCDICFIFLCLFEILPQLVWVWVNPHSDLEYVQVSSSSCFLLPAPSPWYRSGIWQMIFKEQQISILNDKEMQPRRTSHSWKLLHTHYRFSCACSWSISTILFQMTDTCQVQTNSNASVPMAAASTELYCL